VDATGPLTSPHRGYATSSTVKDKNSKKPRGEKRYWPHLWVRCHPRGGSGGPLSVPYRPGTPVYKLQVNTKSGACIHVFSGSDAATCSVAPDPASLLGRALVRPHAQWLRTPPPYYRGLRYHHMSSGSRSRLPAKEGSNATVCPMASGRASLVRRLQHYSTSRGSLWATGDKHK
jgi:hypothetical protein